MWGEACLLLNYCSGLVFTQFRENTYRAFRMQESDIQVFSTFAGGFVD